MGKLTYKTSPVITRCEGNPILQADPANEWEAHNVSNAVAAAAVA